ncbi:MAG: class I SAM-dependent methyltransferase [Oscillospiraceae bacterium]|jgi:ubiquinone/menaquinone biosynthesis C-methylase UbiE|nr:class I SAM-dependent methyltransferase [Oscillospiraceae bacterium]
MDINFEKFTGLAELYDSARPSYADAAVSYILTNLAPPNPVVADVGAGTGKFSEQLAPLVNKLYAIEPNADMREKLTAALAKFPNSAVVGASAESTALPDSSVDLVVCAQAFHWFDPGRFRAECSRILKPGGQIAIVYNSHSYPRSPNVETRELICSLFFGGAFLRAAFPNPTQYDRDGWLTYMMSHSDSPRFGDANYESFVEDQLAQFDSESYDGIYTMQLSTHVFSKL